MRIFKGQAAAGTLGNLTTNTALSFLTIFLFKNWDFTSWHLSEDHQKMLIAGGLILVLGEVLSALAYLVGYEMTKSFFPNSTLSLKDIEINGVIGLSVLLTPVAAVEILGLIYAGLIRIRPNAFVTRLIDMYPRDRDEAKGMAKITAGLVAGEYLLGVLANILGAESLNFGNNVSQMGIISFASRLFKKHA